MSAVITPQSTVEKIAALVQAEPALQISLMAYMRDGDLRWDVIVTGGAVEVGQSTQGAAWQVGNPDDALAQAHGEYEDARESETP